MFVMAGSCMYVWATSVGLRSAIFSRSLDRLQTVLLDAARDVGTGEVECLGHGFEEGSRASRLELQIPAGHIRLRVPLIRKVLSRCWEIGAAQNAHAEDRV